METVAGVLALCGISASRILMDSGQVLHSVHKYPTLH